MPGLAWGVDKLRLFCAAGRALLSRRSCPRLCLQVPVANCFGFRYESLVLQAIDGLFRSSSLLLIHFLVCSSCCYGSCCDFCCGCCCAGEGAVMVMLMGMGMGMGMGMVLMTVMT